MGKYRQREKMFAIPCLFTRRWLMALQNTVLLDTVARAGSMKLGEDAEQGL